MHFVRNIIVAVLITMAGICLADPPAPFPIEINSQSRVAPEVWTFRNNVRTFRATFKDGTNEVNLVGATPFMSWSTNEMASGVVTSSWALVNSGTNGIVDFTFQAAALNYATITNVYEIGVAGTVSVYNRGRFLIKPSPFSTGTNMPVFTTNQNLTGYTFSGQPWLENLTLTTGGASYAWSGAGTTRNLNVPVAAAGSGSGITTNLLSSNAIITVYGGATAQPALNVSTSALATALAGTLAAYATGTPLYAFTEADTNANANIGAASNALRLATGLLTTNQLANGLQITNNLIAQGLINTQLIANGLADTNDAAALVSASNSLSARITATESYTSLVVATALYTNRAASALASSVWDAADSTTNYFTRVMGIGTSNSLDGRLDLVEAYTSLTVATALYTNRAAGALQSSVWANADSTTNNFTAIMGIGTSNSLDARLDAVEPYTSRVVTLEGYTATVVNIQGQVTTNLTLQGGIRTDLTTFAASATNVFGQVTTNDAFDITSTNRNQQNVIGNFSFADSAILGANIVSNGAFANGTNTSANFWTFTLGFEWNSGSGGRALVSAGSTASAIQSNRIPFNPGQDLYVSYTNILSWTGSIVITVGGYTNSSTVTTGSNSFWATTVNDSNIVITINSTNGQAGIDDVQVRIGSGVHGGVAGNWGVGGDLAAGMARVGALTTTGAVTAASLSGTSTSFVEIAGDTMTGPLTGTHVYVSGGFYGGPGTVPTTNRGIGFGEAAVASGSDSMAVGSGVPIASGQASISLGDGNDASGFSSIAIGANNDSRGEASVAIGSSTLSTNANSIAIGYSAIAGNSGSIVLNAIDSGVGSTARDNGARTITFGSAGGIYVSTSYTFSSVGKAIVNIATNPEAANGLPLLKNLTNMGFAKLDASNLVSGSTLPALNAVNITNISAATTAGVNAIVFDGTNYAGNQTFSDSATVNVLNPSNFQWAVIPGALTAINGAGVTGAIPLASLGNVVQTGQVNLIAHNGTNYSGNLTFAGSAVTATGQTININAGSGSGDTFATNLIQNLANVDSIAAPTTGHALLWNGAAWSNGAVSATVNWTTRGITNSFEGFLIYYSFPESTTNNVWSSAAFIDIRLVCSGTNILRDTGTNYGFSAGFVDETNNYFQFPVGWFEVEGAINIAASVPAQGDILLTVNGLTGTNTYYNMPGRSSDSWLWNGMEIRRDTTRGDTFAFRKRMYNTAATNQWKIRGFQQSGGTGYNAADFYCSGVYLGDW